MFTPKLFTVLSEGYGLASLRADLIAGLTVAIVALPLSMAIAIASGVPPDRGLYAAIIGGFFVSAFGGSRFQIGGPAGAFIVLVAATVHTQGVDGLILATMISGVFLLIIGFLRLGTFIKYVPFPVTVGFTAGIAIIIFASQIKDLFGLTLDGPEPGPLTPKLEVLAGAADTVSGAAVAIALTAMVTILAIRKWKPSLPGMLIAVIVTSLAAALLGLPVETIGTRFGGIASSLPAPSLPAITLDKVQAVLPHAISFTLLGAIESLLSAVVADGMTGRRHRSNCELVAQGIANIASSLFGGLCVTGTIARTATNVRSGARGPLAGMFHSMFVLVFILAAAPLASFIPLAALAGILAIVAWDMAEKHAFAILLRASWGDAVVLLSTFGLTIFRGLTEGIVVGFTLGVLLFIHRLAEASRIESGPAFAPEDQADRHGDHEPAYDASLATDADVMVYRIKGAFFFGAASTVGAVLDRIGERQRAFVIDFEAVPLVDSTAAHTIASFVAKARRRNIAVYLTGTLPPVRDTLNDHGITSPEVQFVPTIAEAVTAARAAAENSGNP